MKQFMQFVQNHWQLWGVLVVILLWLVAEEIFNKIGALRRVTPIDATFMLNHENALVVDLRPGQAFAKGHILHALNIPAKEFIAHSNKLLAHKDRPIILLESSDVTAKSIAKKLTAMGFAKIYLLAGGIEPWKSAGLPLTVKN